MNVLFAAAECVPFVKTGGLADVIGALPKALVKQGMDARVILPKYKDIPDSYRHAMKHIQSFHVQLGWRELYCGIDMLEHEGVTYYFIDNEYYFCRDGLYGYGHGGDDAERFAFFCKAILESIPQLGFQVDILHAHDWHTALIPVMLHAQYKGNAQYDRIRTLFTIHNLQYQGIFPATILGDVLGLGDEYFTFDRLEYHGQVNFMKAGIVFADQLTTVSESYAAEIQTDFFGEQLDGVLRTRSHVLSGIVNGIDTDGYNPATDPHVWVQHPDIRLQKQLNKRKLQESLNLPVRDDVPMIAMITRLTRQKGLDLVLRVLDEILESDLQFVLLGTGDWVYEQAFRDAAHRYPEKMSVQLRFDEALSRNLYLSSDLFLMPSLFEPCGVSQLIAMRYGSIPIVRETGGLRDTVCPFDESSGLGNGFSFSNINAHDMLYTIRYALDFYHRKDVWDHLLSQTLTTESSWKKSANQYLVLYNHLLSF